MGKSATEIESRVSQIKLCVCKSFAWVSGGGPQYAARIDWKTCYRLALLSLLHIWTHVFWSLIRVQRKRSTRSLFISTDTEYHAKQWTLSLSLSASLAIFIFSNRLSWIFVFHFNVNCCCGCGCGCCYYYCYRLMRIELKRGALMLIIRHCCAFCALCSRYSVFRCAERFCPDSTFNAANVCDLLITFSE